MIRVLLCDDHRIVREGLKLALGDSTDILVVAEAQSGLDALNQVRALQGTHGLDVVLLDIAMAGMDGLQVLQNLRREHPTLPVLMLSTYPERQYAVHCMRLGAAGYLNKSADPDAMVDAVRQLARGQRYVSADTAQALAAALGARSTPGVAGLDALSYREAQVCRLLTEGQSVSQIGALLGLAPNTVSTYRARILEKMGARNDVELALLATRSGTATPSD